MPVFSGKQSHFILSVLVAKVPELIALASIKVAIYMPSCLCLTILPMHMALPTCNSTRNSANNHHFPRREKPLSGLPGRSGLLAPSRQVCYHLSSASGGERNRRWVGRRGVAVEGGGQRGGSILIKGPGSEPGIKIATGGDWHRFLQALTARLTAALRCRGC